MHKYCSLFWSFFKVGSFTIGGGYAMIPLMQQELVVRRQWIGEEDFLDLVALSQSLPGVFAVNIATLVGHKMGGAWGSIAAVAGNILMPIAFILAIALFFRHFRSIALVEHIFYGIRPAVVALIAAPVFTMARSAHVSWRNCWIPIVSAALIWLFGVNPILIVLASAGLGILIYYFNKKHTIK